MNDQPGFIPIRCIAVACFVLRKTAAGVEVLLLERSDDLFHGAWCPVTGKIEGSETGWAAAVREVTEETGLVPWSLFTADYCDQFYNAYENMIETLPIFVAFVSNDSRVVIGPEHTQFEWLPMDEASGTASFLGHKLALQHIAAVFAGDEPPGWLRVSEYAV